MFLPDLVTLFEAPFLKPFMVTFRAAPDSATEEIYMSVTASKHGVSPQRIFFESW